MLKYYQTLGVDQNATIEDIKKSYKKLAFECHPDRNDGKSEKFLEVHEAYQYLLENHRSPNNASFTKMFSEMFKTMHKEPIKSHVIRLNLSLLEAIEGVEKTLNIKFDVPCDCPFVMRDRCKKCGGVGYVKEDRVGTFRFSNIAHQNQTYIYKNYYKGINLQIKVNIISTGQFYLKKDTLYSDVPLNIFKAILGGTEEVKTPKSVSIVEIPEGRIKDFSCKLQGKGLSGKDLIINFKLFLPKNLTLQQKKLLNIIIDENKN